MNIEDWAWLVVPLGATRAMQIALWDKITERPRAWLLVRLNPNGYDMTDSRRPYLSYLLECPWCMSVWIGAVISTLLVFDATRVPALWVLAALAVSLAAVVIDRLIDVYASDEAAAAREHRHEPAVATAAVVVADPSASERGIAAGVGRRDRPMPAAPPGVEAAFGQREAGVAHRHPEE